jgi:chromosome segregation protein
MYLKQIDLENFKSFGRKMRIPFNHGFTAITGPNGSGKSNISDAILFVLGPRSSKAIRAGKLTDLIFNGGRSRSAASSCRVSLVFDNSDRVLPIDSEEVTLSRVVKLSSSKEGGYYSYFYVNGRSSSLQQFDQILSRARISADGYNFVQQGDINRIVGMSNLERRRILDDIAGITEYDADIQRAEKQRAEAEANLEKIGILLNEIKRNIEALGKDRSNAVKYRELQERLQLARAQLAHKRKEEVEDQLHGTQKQIDEYDLQRGQFRGDIEEKRTELAKLEEELQSLEKEIIRVGGEGAERLKQEIDGVRLERMRAQDREEKGKERIEELKAARTAQQQEMRGITKQLETYHRQLKELGEDVDGHKGRVRELSEQLDDAHAEAATSSKDIEELQRELAKMRKEHDEVLEDQHAIALERDRAKDRSERAALELAQTEESIKTLEFEVKDLDFSTKDLQKTSKSAKDNIKGLQEDIFKARADEKRLMKEAAELEEEIKRLSREYQTLKAESEAAAQLERGYTRAVNSIIDARDRGKLKGVLGTIAELADVEKKYEDALTVAAGTRMQSIVVEDDDAAAQCINYLKKTKIGRATFLPLNKMRGGRPAGKALMAVRDPTAIGFARDLVKYDERYEAAFWYAFGDTVVVKDLDAARRLMGGVRLVTVDGELTETSGAMVGGTLARSGLKFGTPQKSEFDRVSKALREAVDHADATSAALQATRERAVALEDELRSHRGEDDSAASRIGDIDLRMKEYRARLEGLRAERKKLKEAVEAASAEVGTQSKELEGCAKRIAELEAARDQLSKRLTKATPEDLSRRIQQLQEHLAEEREALRDAESKVETLQTQYGLMQKHESDVSGKLAEIEQDSEESKRVVAEAKEAAKQLDVELKSLLKVEEKTSSEVERLRTSKDKVFEHKTRLSSDIDKLETKLDTHADLMVQLKVKVQNLEGVLREAEAEVARYDVHVKQPLPPIDQLNQTVRECETGMARLEPVNMRSIEEYDSQVARREELEGELKTLEKQRKDLLKLVEELNKKKKYGLYKVFDAINKNFSDIFAVLSNGGEAKLVLENPEEPFQGGLLIEARPPHGKVLRLESLSGGEKSLTALALIFSIQQFDPSPFYLLDEVDMFLDAVNAENVARMVARNAEIAQFIMISLRKVTLSKADHLYGVTKQQTGVSDVVGKVNLAELKEEPREAVQSMGAATQASTGADVAAADVTGGAVHS